MERRLFTAFVVICIGWGWAGCSFFQSLQPHHEEDLMPRQTGSLLQRRLPGSPEPDVRKPKKEKEKESKKRAPEQVADEAASPTPAPKRKARKVRSTPKPTPAEESTEPDRFR